MIFDLCRVTNHITLLFHHHSLKLRLNLHQPLRERSQITRRHTLIDRTRHILTQRFQHFSFAALNRTQNSAWFTARIRWHSLLSPPRIDTSRVEKTWG